MASGAVQAKQRLLRDFKNLLNDSPFGINASPTGDDIFEWTGVIQGPYDTVWEGGAFAIQLSFPKSYPAKPPVCRFLTPVYHPNVYKDGLLCLNVLKEQWSSVMDIRAVLLSIQSMLDDPYDSSAANGEAACLHYGKREIYNEIVRKCCQDCWDHPSMAEFKDLKNYIDVSDASSSSGNSSEDEDEDEDESTSSPLPEASSSAAGDYDQERESV